MSATRFTLTLVGVIVFFAAPTVMADTVSISFVSDQFDSPTLSRTYSNPDAPEIVATATATEGADSAYLFGYFMGLGVIGQDGDPFQLDGRPDLEGAETLWLQFEKPVALESATFSRVGTLPKRDHFRLLVDGTEAARGMIPRGNWLDLGTGTVLFDEPIVGTLFGFTVTNRADDYVLRQIKVTAAPVSKDGPIAVVTIPLPAAAWAGMALLGAIVAVRQIRRMMRE